MNPFSRNLSSALLLSLICAGPAAAQQLISPKDGPAEYPPASYSGKQYVDSRGCVYIRAGFDGQVTWVPRLARNRSPVCGFQPTQVAGATRTAPPMSRSQATEIIAAVPETSATPEPVPARTATVAPARKPPTTRPAPAQARVVTPAPAPQVITSTSVTGPVRRVAPQASAPVIRVPAAPVVEARPRVVVPVTEAPRATTQVTSLCSTLSPVGQRYVAQGNGGYAVRCGPQADYAPRAGQVIGGAPRVVAPGYAAPSATVASVPSYEKRAATAAPVTVTRVVRARTTATHQISPQARVLPEPVYKERVMSQDVTIPKGYRPIWEDDRLNPRRAEQTLAGKRQMEMVWTKTVPRRLVPVEVVPPSTTAASVSTRSAAPEVKRVALSGQFIQVGSFRTPANAQATAQRLAATGLPVLIRRSASGEVVMAGPFSSDRALGNALAAAHRAGFPGAFPRR